MKFFRLNERQWIIIFIISVLFINPQIVIFNSRSSGVISDPLEVFYLGLFLTLPTILFLPILGRANSFPHISRGILLVSLFFALCTIFPIHDNKSINMDGFSSSLNIIVMLSNLMVAAFVVSLKKIIPYIKYLLLLLLTGLFVSNYVHLIYERRALVSLPKIELGTNNLVVISFDGIPGETINSMLLNTTSEFKDFTVFNNTFSNSPATIASIFNEVFGGEAWKSVATTESQLIQLGNNKIHDKDFKFVKNGANYGSYATVLTGADRLYPEGFTQGELDLTPPIKIFSSALCRVGMCALGDKYGWLENYFFYFGFKPSWIIGDAGVNHGSYNDLRQIGSYFKITNSKHLTAFFGHFTFSHFPIAHDENCKFLQHDKILQDENAVKDQAGCVLSLMSEFIKKLRQMGIYDNTTLIFKSDHGKPKMYFDDGIRSTGFNGHEYFGYDRYRPFLMVKGKGQVSDSLRKSNEVILLSDLSRFYVEVARNRKNTVLLDTLMTPESSKAYFFVPFNKESTHRYDTHEMIETERSLNAIMKMFLRY